MVDRWVTVLCPQHHAAEGMQMSVGTVSPSLREYRRVHICSCTPLTNFKLKIELSGTGLSGTGNHVWAWVKPRVLTTWLDARTMHVGSGSRPW